MALTKLLTQIKVTADCEVYPVRGLPIIKEEHIIPDDMKEFYELCGGVSLFRHQSKRFCIVPPENVALANPILEPEVSKDQRDRVAGDISWSWYIIAHDWGGNYLTIDLSQQRLGWCYNSFLGYHAMPGYCPIIAHSFTELVKRLYESGDDAFYWDEPNFTSLGDAYDGIDYQRDESNE